MRLRFVGQPLQESTNLHEFLVEACDQSEEITCVTAWAKRSGLARLEARLRAFRNRGGRARVILGIDEGGATRQGLEMALSLFDEAFVYWSSDSRTFHPKLYMSSWGTCARILVGSNNVTAGGLFYNYEAAVIIELDLSLDEDREFWEAASSYVDELVGDTACVRLTNVLLPKLIAASRFRIGDENHRKTGASAVVEDTDVVGTEGEQPIFTSSSLTKKPVVPLPAGYRAPSGGPRRTATPQGRESPERPESREGEGGGLVVEAEWSKRLTRSDARHPAGGSHPTNTLRLSQAGYEIDQKTYFRDDFFGSAAWYRDQQDSETEIAMVDFDVTVVGGHIGTETLRVDHNARRVSNQNNAPTFLRWNDSMGSILSGANYTGHRLRISRLSDGTFRMVIEA